jgi:hypothetical protein
MHGTFMALLHTKEQCQNCPVVLSGPCDEIEWMNGCFHGLLGLSLFGYFLILLVPALKSIIQSDPFLICAPYAWASFPHPYI